MYKKIKDFFTTNLYWKAISVLIAIILWFIVMNISNPTEIKTFTLNVSLINKEKLDSSNIVILNMQDLENQKAEIKIKASRTTLDELSKKINRENIKLIIDLEQFSTYKIGDKPLETTVNLKPDMPNIPYPNNSFEIVSFAPVTANVYIDKIITIEKRIYPRLIGKVKDGYIASNPILSSQNVKITGAKSVLDTIEKVYAKVDVNNQTSTISKDIDLVAYNKEGEEVNNIKFEKTSVNIKIPIISKGAININEPKLVGSLPDGYMISNITYEPKTIEVIGDEKDISKISYITLPNINISNLTKDTSYTYNISSVLERNKLTLKNGSTNINVKIEIDKAQSKNIVLTSNNIKLEGLNSEYIATIPDKISFSVIGKKEDVEKLDNSKIEATLDLTNLNEGKHNIKLNIKLDNNIKLSKDVYVDIDIKKNEQNSSPEEESLDKIENTETTSSVQETQDSDITEKTQ